MLEKEKAAKGEGDRDAPLRADYYKGYFFVVEQKSLEAGLTSLVTLSPENIIALKSLLRDYRILQDRVEAATNVARQGRMSAAIARQDRTEDAIALQEHIEEGIGIELPPKERRSSDKPKLRLVKK